jgi:hypothetical protein
MSSVNTFFRSVVDDLVEKRLWPVAVVLGILLIGIPLLLSRSTKEEPVAPAPAVAPAVGSGGALSAFQPVVDTQGKKSSEIRKDLEGFESKDPFKPQNLGGGGSGTGSVEVQSAGASATPTGGAGGGSADVSDSPPLGTSGGGSGDGSSTGSSGDSSAPAKTFYYHYTADVRFGKEGNLDRKTLSEFRALPSSQDPVVVFMGVRQDGETAIFLVSGSSSTTGEGNCQPDDTCTFLYMKKDDKQRFESVNAENEVVTYELVLLDIGVKRTDAPDKAQSSSRSKRSRRNVENAKGRENPFARGFQAIGF